MPDRMHMPLHTPSGLHGRIRRPAQAPGYLATTTLPVRTAEPVTTRMR
jgi:hypothetical protein